MADSEDPRRARTREALRQAFRELALDRRWSRIRIADVIARAGVGRSTFYEHFRSKEDMLRDGLQAPLRPLADAAAGLGEEAALVAALEHFWLFRGVGNAMLSDGARGLAIRLLTEMTAERLAARPKGRTHPRQTATFLASGLIETLAEWLAGRLPGSPAALAADLRKIGAAVRGI